MVIDRHSVVINLFDEFEGLKVWQELLCRDMLSRNLYTGVWQNLIVIDCIRRYAKAYISFRSIPDEY